MSYVENLKDCTKQVFQSLLVTYQGDFAMLGGELRTKEYSSNAYRFWNDNRSQASYTCLIFSSVDCKLDAAKAWRFVSADEVDYELYLGTKMD